MWSLKNSSFRFGFLRAVVNLAGAQERAALLLEQHTGERRKQEHRQHRRTERPSRCPNACAPVRTPMSLIATMIMEHLGLKTSAELVQYVREHGVLKKRT